MNQWINHQSALQGAGNGLIVHAHTTADTLVRILSGFTHQSVLRYHRISQHSSNSVYPWPSFGSRICIKPGLPSFTVKPSMSPLERLLGCLKHMLGQSALAKRQEQGDADLQQQIRDLSCWLGNRLFQALRLQICSVNPPASRTHTIASDVCLARNERACHIYDKAETMIFYH